MKKASYLYHHVKGVNGPTQVLSSYRDKPEKLWAAQFCVSGCKNTVRSCFLQIRLFFLCSCAGQRSNSVISVSSVIVIRGDWLGKPANIKVENNGAVGYVKSSLTVHNPSVCVHKTE